MAKMQEAQSDESKVGHVEQQTEADQEATAAHTALTEAAALAADAASAGDAGEGAKVVAPARLSKDEHRALSRQIAKRQRELGSKELERQYPNTIVVPAKLSIGDANLASSATRFLGLADRTLYLLNRYGQRYLGAADLQKVRDAMASAVEQYADEAKKAAQQGAELKTVHQTGAGSQTWFEPVYTSRMMDTSFNVKARQAMVLVEALHHWDAAILAFSALSFNGLGNEDQVDTLRQRERGLFMAINKLCLRTINALGQRSAALARSAKSAAAVVADDGHTSLSTDNAIRTAEAIEATA